MAGQPRVESSVRSLVLCVLAMLATSCHPTELRDFERSAGACLERAWNSSGLPSPSKGRCDVSSFSVRIDSPESFVEDCRTAPSSAYACTSWTTDSRLFFYRETPVVVIAPWWHSEPTVIQHELIHAYAQCSGISPDGDARHKDARLWSSAGGSSSIQSRALALLQAQ